MLTALFLVVCMGDVHVRNETSYSVPLFPEAVFATEITKPEEVLGFPVGERTANPDQIETLLQQWSLQTERGLLKTYAHSHEGRPLSVMIISSPANLKKLDEYQSNIQKLRDPRKLSDGEAQNLMRDLPATAWLAYSIHGNESSGSDASIALIYYLLAAQSPELDRFLNEMIIFIDPMMNPDGRARFCKELQETRGQSPNFDNQSLLHSGSWPYGRTNHYFYDLNRDFTLGINPETIGRVRMINQWAPQLFVDAHEMGSTSTFLFSPAREPINLHLAGFNKKWGQTFAIDQAHAFDERGWRYFTGEWNDNWYPGYSFWCAYRGSLTILYEQARLAEDGVKRPEGTIMTYRESVHHQLASSLTNLKTLLENHQKMRQDFWADRKKVVSAESPYAGVTYAILPSQNGRRMREFIRTLQLQSFELYELSEAYRVKSATNQLGQKVADIVLPVGTLLLPRLQSEARLLTSMMEFDPRIPMETLKKERREILEKGGSIMYDTTGWCATMLHDLESYELPEGLPSKAKAYVAQDQGPLDQPLDAEALAYVWNGLDDNSVAVAARLMEQGIQVRVADETFKFEDDEFPRGSVLVVRADQSRAFAEIIPHLETVSKELSIKASAIHTGWGDGDLADLGGDHFQLLEKPHIAMYGRGTFSSYDYGSIWHVIDRYLGVSFSQLDSGSSHDLRRYNVIILPTNYGSLDESLLKRLKEWVKTGGTLITVGQSSAQIANEKAEFSKVRQLSDVLEKLDEYELDLLKKWEAKKMDWSTDEIWSNSPPNQQEFPWSNLPKRAEKDELAKQDAWRAQFMPQGAIFAARADQNHWLTLGCREYVPTMYSRDPLLMTTDEAPVRFGVMIPKAQAVPKKKAAETESLTRAGWAMTPEGQELRLRMSGLLWPEASDRIANAAYLTRERFGLGQIIMFASSPAFRGTTMGTIRLLINAITYGPGLGTSNVNNLDLPTP